MEKERFSHTQGQKMRSRLDQYPPELFAALVSLSAESKMEFFLVGGTIRDWLLDRQAGDVDITVAKGAIDCCHRLIEILGAGTFVLLGRNEDAGRVVWRGLTIDFSSFRNQTVHIEDDLRSRDFTVNAMAVSLDDLMDAKSRIKIIDPLGGLVHLEQGVLHSCKNSFRDDPLRMLRAFRMSAVLGFVIDADTGDRLRSRVPLINNVSVERVSYELDLIIGSHRASQVIEAMAEIGLLWKIIPELQAGMGLEQPGFHHLDVFNHSLAALGYMEEIVLDPDHFFPNMGEAVTDYLHQPGIISHLKWAALLHDIGKPPTYAIREDKGGRVVFYNHDNVGRELVLEIGIRLRWSRVDREAIGALVASHMHPFHLCNVQRQRSISKKSGLKLCKRAGDQLIGLFLLAMSDSLAGQGEMKPEGMEDELRQLFDNVQNLVEKNIKPVLAGPKLLTGQDLIREFHLTPGPEFSDILDKLHDARVEGSVNDRNEALEWVQDYLKS